MIPVPYTRVTTHVLLGKIFQCCEAVTHCHSRHPSMEGYRNDVVAGHRQPPDTGVHVLTEETADRLRETEGVMEGGKGRGRDRREERE